MGKCSNSNWQHVIILIIEERNYVRLPTQSFLLYFDLYELHIYGWMSNSGWLKVTWPAPNYVAIAFFFTSPPQPLCQGIISTCLFQSVGQCIPRDFLCISTPTIVHPFPLSSLLWGVNTDNKIQYLWCDLQGTECSCNIANKAIPKLLILYHSIATEFMNEENIFSINSHVQP